VKKPTGNSLAWATSTRVVHTSSSDSSGASDSASAALARSSKLGLLESFASSAGPSFTAPASGEGASPSPSAIVDRRSVALDCSAAKFARTGTLKNTKPASAHEKAYPNRRIVEHILPAARN
jgi:hypothetical protein